MVAERETFDDLVAGLNALRDGAGSPSFGVVVDRIAERRVANGVDPGVAAPGRTTVYDAFRAGRSRLDADLVREIVLALGEDGPTADAWHARCRAAVRSRPVEQQPERESRVPIVTRRRLATLLVTAVAINLVGRVLAYTLDLSLHLDMIGTCLAAVAAGPLAGGIVGLGTNVLGASISGPSSFLFVPVNVIGGILWGAGVRRGLGASYARFAGLALAVAVACTVVATPIIVIDGLIDRPSADVSTTLVQITGSEIGSIFSANLLTSVFDKLVSGFVALALIGLLAWPTPAGRVRVIRSGTTQQADPGDPPAVSPARGK